MHYKREAIIYAVFIAATVFFAGVGLWRWGVDPEALRQPCALLGGIGGWALARFTILRGRRYGDGDDRPPRWLVGSVAAFLVLGAGLFAWAGQLPASTKRRQGLIDLCAKSCLESARASSP